MKIIHNIKLPVTATHQEAVRSAAKKAGIAPSCSGFVQKEALDCRRSEAYKIFSVVLDTEKESPLLKEYQEYVFTPPKPPDTKIRPYIIGTGPAGLFCALTLLDFGVRPILIERGDPVEKRAEKVSMFWKGNSLDTESNVQFGEGGAGTFSDGKLTTRIHDPRCRKVLELFVAHGAPEEILWKAKAHIGTDLLRQVIVNIRNDILSRGGEFRFRTKLENICIQNQKLRTVTLNGEEFPAEKAVLAVGNGATDTFSMLLEQPLVFETKPMAFGFRQEHLQKEIDDARYRRLPDSIREILPPADYSFYTHLTPETCVYTFCMCPGGSVVNASSLPGRLTVNGMSRHARDGKNANAALLVSYRPKTVQQALSLQKELEERAFTIGNGRLPITRDLDKAKTLTGVSPTAMPNTCEADFSRIFPREMLHSLQNGARLFQKEVLHGATTVPPVYTAPETRSSSPLRIKRDPETLQAVKAEGVYPCGEGAGYAGGIMSSAVDGLRTAEKILTEPNR